MRRRVELEPAEEEFLDELEPGEGFDDGLPHGGLWSRPDGGEDVRCAEHDLRPDEH